MKLCLPLCLLVVHASVAAAMPVQIPESPEASVPKIEAAGLCVHVGIDPAWVQASLQSSATLLHCLDSDAKKVDAIRALAADAAPQTSLRAEVWTANRLPWADNLVNALICLRDDIPQEEILRVLRPGGRAWMRTSAGVETLTRPWPDGLDDWTHQWHDADGSLSSDDAAVDVPQGIQWLAGPLFAMAGRKNSTQALVSADGRNFYITQNVLQNVGRSEMPQFLVARDAFNGLPLWQRPWTGPFVTGNGEINPRIVASPDRLYLTTDRGVVVLDTATGETERELTLPDVPDKLTLVHSTILLQSASGITAMTADLSSRLWQFTNPNTSGTIVSDGRVLALVSGRSEDGAFRHELICLDVADGRTVWTTDTQPQTAAARLRLMFAEDDFVGVMAHGELHLYSLSSGAHLWSRDTDARPGKTYVDERYVGHFYRHGLVWLLQENSPREPDGQNLWVGLNPATGDVERELKTTGLWPRTDTPAKMGCQLLIASDRYIMIPRQATFIDFATGEKRPFKFTRGGCGLGFVPANGLLYSHPHACGCFHEAIRGFMGMHSTAAPTVADPSLERLRTGPAFGRQLTDARSPAELHAAGQWPMYRADSRRSGATPASLAPELTPGWSVSVAATTDSPSFAALRLRNANPVTAATAADGLVYVADVDAGRVEARHIADGRLAWSHTAGGRVDAPPTIAAGQCVFGSHDGAVYCLDARTGELVWKRLVAPQDRRIVAYGGLESPWPVSGAVLVQDGVAWAAAGRAPDADGGIFVSALDLTSGEELWSSRVNPLAFEGLADYLIADRGNVVLANCVFDPATGEQTYPNDDLNHLMGGKVGLLEASWTRHDLALRKSIQTWTANGHSGQLLAFGDGDTVAYRAESNEVTLEGDTSWTVQLPRPEQVTGLALTVHHVVIGIGSDRRNGLAPGRVQLLDRSTGTIVASQPLSAEPVFDGLAVVDGRVLVSTLDGRLQSVSTGSRPGSSFRSAGTP